MTFSDWLDGERGRAACVAERFGITRSAITQWRTNGVPPDRILEVRDLTDGDVTVEEMLAVAPSPAPAEQGAAA